VRFFRYFLSSFLLFYITSFAQAQTLNCTNVDTYLKLLANSHFSLTESTLKTLEKNAAISLLEDTAAQQTLQNTGGTYKAICEAFVRLSGISNPQNSFYEKFLTKTLDEVDPHTNFFDEPEAKKFSDSLQGEFEGLGITFKAQGENGHGPFRIYAVIPGSPAAIRGLQVDDLILKMNEQNTSDLTREEFHKMIQDQKGSFSLTVQRGDLTLSILCHKERFSNPSVSYYFLHTQGLAYIKINMFTLTTGEELEGVIQFLQNIYEDDLKGILLDLRENLGGNLSAAIKVADIFIDRGPLVYAYNKNNELSNTFEARGVGVTTSAPLLILTNNFSASASEVVTGALQDYGRAFVVGKPSFGKGTILGFWPLENTTPNYHGAITFTTSAFFRPSGQTVQWNGVTPDLEIEDPQITKPVYERDHPKALHLDPIPREFNAPYAFRQTAKTIASAFSFRNNYSNFENSDIQLTKATDLLKRIALIPEEPSHFGPPFYYAHPSHRLHMNTDLYEPESKLVAKFSFKVRKKMGKKKSSPIQEETLYETFGFVTGNELTLSLQNTPVETYVTNYQNYGSVILEVTIQKKTKANPEIQTFTYKTFVLFDPL